MKIHTHQTLVVGIVVLLCVGLAPSVSAAGETPTCHYVAYTADYESRHFSLLMDNSTMVGTDFIIEQPSQCSLDLVLDDGITFSIEGNSSLSIPLSTSAIKITQNNITTTYSSLTFFPAGSVLYSEIIDSSILSEKTNSEIWWGEILSHVVTFFLLYFLSTTIVYRIAKNKVDNSCEVVI